MKRVDKCECGGTVYGVRGFGRLFTWCSKCTPVVRVKGRACATSGEGDQVSAFSRRGVRCDWCGKFSNHADGKYTKHDGTAIGYINQPQWERNHVDASGKHCPIDSELDICEECEAGLCQKCGGDQLVRITPATPGPSGWGWRCKACGHRWEIPAREETAP